MDFTIGLLLGASVGLGLYFIYSWLMDKLNLIKLGYSGGSFIVRWIYKKFIRK